MCLRSHRAGELWAGELWAGELWAGERGQARRGGGGHQARGFQGLSVSSEVVKGAMTQSLPVIHPGTSRQTRGRSDLILTQRLDDEVHHLN